MRTEQLQFSIQKNEFWWGGSVNCGYQMPIKENSNCTVDLNGVPGSDQYSPLFVSSHGRYLWSTRPYILTAKDGIISCQGDAEITLYDGYTNLKGAYLAACAAHFPFSDAVPDKRFFSQPQYNTWIELGTNQTATAILKYARSILEHDMPAGILMIDEGWQEDYGVFEFNRRKIPHPVHMIQQLHEMGFAVMLWVTPIVSCAGPQYNFLHRRGWLIKDNHGRIALRSWWNGTSALIDLTNPEALDWYHQQLHCLMDRYKIDGFKFDAGDSYFYRDDDQLYRKAPVCEQTQLYNQLGAQYAFNEFRAAWCYGGQPIVARLQDKRHSWDDFGINTLIPHTILQGLLGYAYNCPDMVGGGSIDCFEGNKKLDEELFVRWAQASALMGMMQMSISPWRVLKKENAALVVEAMHLHTSFGKQIYALAQHAAATGEPIVRAMAYEYPDEEMESLTEQFMLGSNILVAPVVHKNAKEISVHLPKGKWIGWNGACYDGGCILTAPVTLKDTPYFTKID